MATDPELVVRRKGASPSVLLFIHGFTGGHATWGRFTDTIIADNAPNSPFADWSIVTFGYPSRLAGGWLPFWTGNPDLPILAQQLETTCEAGELSKFKSFAVVAHSMGGLIAQRALIDAAKLRAKTTLFFMYGTPSLGARVSSWIVLPHKQIPQMAPGNPFLNTLRADWTATFGDRYPFAFRTVAGNQDNFVLSSSSLAPFPTECQSVVKGDHLSMIRCAALSDPAVDLLAKGLTRAPFDLGPIGSGVVAAEKAQFNEAVVKLEQHQDELDEVAKVQLALALEMTGRREDAINLLAQHGKSDTDVLGSLGGQLKRRWNVERKKADADRALSLYTEGYERSVAAGNHNQAHYHGVNIAFLQLVYRRDKQKAQETAQAVLKHCEQADDPWRHASAAEANLILEKYEGAMAGYQLARQHLDSPRDKLSAYNQARWILSVSHKEDLLPTLDQAFAVPPE